MSVEENKAVARRASEEAWSQGKLDVVEEVYAADCIMHDLGADYRGPEAIKQYISAVRAAFPDARWDIQLQLAEGDHVATHWVFSGTHEGKIQLTSAEVTVTATGKQVTLEGVNIHRIVGGKIVETRTLREALAPALGFKFVPPEE